jgi:hypothetical protein
VNEERRDRAAALPQAVADAATLLGGETGASRAFLGGLIAGALVGAAIAGAALVRSRAAPLRAVPREDRAD